MATAVEEFLEKWIHPTQTLGRPIPDAITAAVPMYFAIIAVELVYSLAKGKTVYNLRQTVSNLAAGTLSTLLGTNVATRRTTGFHCVVLLAYVTRASVLFVERVCDDCAVVLVCGSLGQPSVRARERGFFNRRVVDSARRGSGELVVVSSFDLVYWC